MLIKKVVIHIACMLVLLGGCSVMASEDTEHVWNAIAKNTAGAETLLKYCSLQALQSRSNDEFGNSLSPAEFVALYKKSLVSAVQGNRHFSLEDREQLPNLYGVVDSLRRKVAIASIPELNAGGVVAAYEAADLLVKKLSNH